MRSTWDVALSIGSLVLVVAIFLWAGYWFLKRSKDPLSLFFRWLITVVLIGLGVGTFFFLHLPLWMLPVICLIFGVPIGLFWASSVTDLILRPFTDSLTGGNRQVDPTPLLSIAESKRQRGQYQEAIAELNKQLSRYPGDFIVLSMIASIQAEDLHDIRSAEESIRCALANPKVPPQTYAAALNTMADWRLKIEDVEGARIYLQQIVDFFPKTLPANNAAQRLSHLASKENMRLLHQSKTYTLKAGRRDIGLDMNSQDQSTPAQADPSAIANDYLTHLQKFPLDTEIREKLAHLYADSYHQVYLAMEQLELLIQRPKEPPKNVVKWLNLAASYQVQYAHDLASGEAALQRIIDLFPKTGFAELALTRKMNLASELKKATQDAKALGNYEKNIGLKNYTASGQLNSEQN